MAEICVTVGQENQALDLLDSLFAIPGFASRAYLKLDFVWDALRQHPRFMALVAPPQDSSAADRP
jgi:hypothetical protein